MRFKWRSNFRWHPIYDRNHLWPKWLKTILWGGAYLYGPHKGVYPPGGLWLQHWKGERGQNVKIGDWETHTFSQTGLLWGVSELLSSKIVGIIFYSVQLSQEFRPQEFARPFFHAVFSRFRHKRGTTGWLILHNLAHILQSGRKTCKSHSAFFPEAWEMFSICTVNLSVMPNNQH